MKAMKTINLILVIIFAIQLISCQKKESVALEFVSSNDFLSFYEQQFTPIINRYVNFASTGSNKIKIAYSDTNQPIMILISPPSSNTTIKTVKVPKIILSEDFSDRWKIDERNLVCLSLPYCMGYDNSDKKTSIFSFAVEAYGFMERLCIEIVCDVSIESFGGNDYFEISTEGNETVFSKKLIFTNNRTEACSLNVWIYCGGLEKKMLKTIYAHPQKQTVEDVIISKGQDLEPVKYEELCFTEYNCTYCFDSLYVYFPPDEANWDATFASTGTKHMTATEPFDFTRIKIHIINKSKFSRFDINPRILDNLGKEIDLFSPKITANGQESEIEVELYPSISQGKYSLNLEGLFVTRTLGFEVKDCKYPVELGFEKVTEFGNDSYISDVTDGLMWGGEYRLEGEMGFGGSGLYYPIAKAFFLNLETGEKKVFDDTMIVSATQSYVVANVWLKEQQVKSVIRVFRKNDAKLLFSIEKKDDFFGDARFDYYYTYESGQYLFFMYTNYEYNEDVIFATLDVKNEKFYKGYVGIKPNTLTVYQANSDVRPISLFWYGDNKNISVDISNLYSIDIIKNQDEHTRPRFRIVQQTRSHVLLDFVYTPAGADHYYDVSGIVCIDSEGKQVWNKKIAHCINIRDENPHPIAMNDNYVIYFTDFHLASINYIMIYEANDGKLLCKRKVTDFIGESDSYISIPNMHFDGDTAYMIVRQGYQKTSIFKINIIDNRIPRSIR